MNNDLHDLYPFQKKILAAVFGGRYSQVVFSAPRGNSKTYLASRAVWEVISPAGDHFAEGRDCVLIASTLEQAGLVFDNLKDWLGTSGQYKFRESGNKLSVVHKQSGVRCRAVSSDARGAFGLGARERIIVCDEPGAWQVRKGALMRDAIETALGKPGASLVVFWIGTQAPAERGWWPDLCRSETAGRTAVFSWIGDPKKWRQKRELWRVNPLLKHFPESRTELLDKLAKARRDATQKGRFLSYRLNVPTADETDLLLSVDQATALFERTPGDRDGKPTVGIDLGANRAWTAAAAIWPSGLVDALAIAPGIPDLAAQEERDAVEVGTYARLRDTGRLMIADGLSVPPVGLLVEAITQLWGEPESVTIDRFRMSELADAAPGWSPEARTTRWSESGYDIRALRELAFDGPLSVQPQCRGLLAESVAAARVENDDAGNVRLVKHGTNNRARDDVAAAFVLAAGAHKRDEDGGSITVWTGGDEVETI